MNPFNFGARVIPCVLVSLILSSDKPLDFYAATVSVTPVGIVKVIEISWNIKYICDSSLPT